MSNDFRYKKFRPCRWRGCPVTIAIMDGDYCITHWYKANGKAGWKVWNAKDNGGTPGAGWFHLEFSPKAADDPDLIVAAWHKAFPK